MATARKTNRLGPAKKRPVKAPARPSKKVGQRSTTTQRPSNRKTKPTRATKARGARATAKAKPEAKRSSTAVPTNASKRATSEQRGRAGLPGTELQPTNPNVLAGQACILIDLLTGGIGRRGLFGGSPPAYFVDLGGSAQQRYLETLANAGYARRRVVQAGRTPIGGGWPRHTRWDITDEGKVFAKKEVARCRKCAGVNEALLADLVAAANERRLPSMAARREQQERERRVAAELEDRTRLAHVERVLAAIATTTPTSRCVPELQDAANTLARRGVMDADTTWLDLDNLVDDLATSFAGAAGEIFAYLAGHARGVGWALAVSHAPPDAVAPSIANVRFEELFEDFGAANPEDLLHACDYLKTTVRTACEATHRTSNPSANLDRLRPVLEAWAKADAFRWSFWGSGWLMETWTSVRSLLGDGNG